MNFLCFYSQLFREVRIMKALNHPNIGLLFCVARSWLTLAISKFNFTTILWNCLKFAANAVATFFLKKTLRKVNDFEFTCFRHCMKCFSYWHKFFVEQLLRWWLAHGFSAVKLFEVMETEQHLFLVMEYASGGKQWRHPKVDIFILSHKLKAIFLLPIVDFDLCLVKQHFLCYIAFGIRIVN